MGASVKFGQSVLYITYDGLLDPLGGSQILPYLKCVSRHPRSVHILSFEKADRLQAGRDRLLAELACLDIAWSPLVFTQGFGFLGKTWDLLRMYLIGVSIVLRFKSKVVHGRGHAASQVGFFLKRLLGCKLIFDFRGFWADERVDKGGWNVSRRFHWWQYQYYKRVEHVLLENADQIVVLTEAVISEVVRLGGSRNRITVIPCCADFDHFSLADPARRCAAREETNLSSDALVLGYLGSVGKMYMTKQFFRLVSLASVGNDRIGVLALTPDVDRFVAEMERYLPSGLHSKVHVMSASRDDVSRLLPAMDILVSFIQPSYARMASSPTKLSESFAAGIPAICNFGVGDVATLMQVLDAGATVDAESDVALAGLVSEIDAIKAKGGVRLRLGAREKLGLEIANDRYKKVYMRLDSHGEYVGA